MSPTVGSTRTSPLYVLIITRVKPTSLYKCLYYLQKHRREMLVFPQPTYLLYFPGVRALLRGCAVRAPSGLQGIKIRTYLRSNTTAGKVCSETIQNIQTDVTINPPRRPRFHQRCWLWLPPASYPDLRVPAAAGLRVRLSGFRRRHHPPQLQECR